MFGIKKQEDYIRKHIEDSEKFFDACQERENKEKKMIEGFVNDAVKNGTLNARQATEILHYNSFLSQELPIEERLALIKACIKNSNGEN